MPEIVKITNAITVDVEDYFHVSAFSDTISRDDWPGYESRVERNTRDLLRLFDNQKVTGTFFVLGWVAEKAPQLIREIAAAGHEVACHGYGHELIYNQSPEEFKEETRRSKAILEDIVQTPILGYRAASYSITRKSLWALDILIEEGFQYDSSIFPIRHDRYGMMASPNDPYILVTKSGRKINEFPMSTAGIFGFRMPIAGGGYFRIYPFWVTKLAIRSKARKGIPYVFYLHPWEIDPDQPRIEASWFSRFRHYHNIGKTQSRLEYLLRHFAFGTMTQVLDNSGELREFRIEEL